MRKCVCVVASGVRGYMGFASLELHMGVLANISILVVGHRWDELCDALVQWLDSVGSHRNHASCRLIVVWHRAITWRQVGGLATVTCHEQGISTKNTRW